MRSRKGENAWREVQKSKLWNLPDENGILPALRLSYFHLSPILKQCFALFAIFPKDEEIMQQELIHLWMANGFISSREHLAVEEVGNMIWNDLYQKSFFQDVWIDGLGVIYFKMQDLVHDLAQSITEQECIYLEDLDDIDPAALPENSHQLPPLGKLPSLKKLQIRFIDCVQYVDGDECYDNVEVSAFPSLESLIMRGLPSLERLLKTETGGAFPYLSQLIVIDCPKLQLSFLPCVKNLYVERCNNELLKSISRLSSLDSLRISSNEDVTTSFPEGMMNNLTNLKTLDIFNFRRLKELPCEIGKLNALESLRIESCHELESFPEQALEGLHSLRTLSVSGCQRLRSLPDGVQHLTSLEALSIEFCPILHKRCKKGTEEDWHKIEHIPKLRFYPPNDNEDS